jgi:hypothetical protein
VWGDVAGSFAAVVPLVAAIVAVCWVRPTRGRREKRRRRSRETSNLNLDGTGSWNEEKTSPVSLKYGGLGHFLAGQRAREDPDEKEMARHNRAVKRGWSSWGKDWEDWKRRNGIEAGDGIHKVHGRMSLMFREDFTYSKFPGFEKDRKYAIRFVYLSFGWPAEENWLGWEQVSTGYKRSLPIVICRQLNIPESSVESVKKIMRDIYTQMNLGYTEYDPSENRRINCGKPLIEDMSKDALCVYRQIEVGQSLGNVTCTLNKRRRRNGRPPVSYGAVQRFVKESEVISRQKRQTQKSGGKEDWVQARFVLFSQVLRQLKKAERIEAGGGGLRPGGRWKRRGASGAGAADLPPLAYGCRRGEVFCRSNCACELTYWILFLRSTRSAGRGTSRSTREGAEKTKTGTTQLEVSCQRQCRRPQSKTRKKHGAVSLWLVAWTRMAT